MTMMRPRNERGAAAIEFAVVLPLLLMLVFGIIEFGLLLYNKAMITNASREAARAGIVFDTDGNGDLDRLSKEEIESIVEAYCQDYLVTFPPNPEDPEPPPAKNPQTSTVPGDPRYVPPGELLTVSVSYRYNFLLVPGFIADMGLSTDLLAQTTMRAE